MQFKGVIFDLDGTLVNSIEDLADSMNRVLRQNNLPVHNIEAYKYFVGNGLRNLVKAALPESYQEEAVINNFMEEMMQIYSDNCINKTTFYEDIPDLLDALVLQDMKAAVFSNKPDELTKKVVKALFPSYHFEAVIGFTHDSLKKPNPSVPLHICDTLGLLPKNVLYVGDSGIDMQTAKNAGMYAIGALWGFRTKEELTANGAKYFLKHPLDLLNIL
jgi:phosphoglycolate phosphatase